MVTKKKGFNADKVVKDFESKMNNAMRNLENGQNKMLNRKAKSKVSKPKKGKKKK